MPADQDAELVRRLREHSPEEPWTGKDGLFCEAAASIEELRAELAQARTQRDDAIGHYEHLCEAKDEERNRLLAELAEVQAAIRVLIENVPPALLHAVVRSKEVNTVHGAAITKAKNAL